MGLVVSLSACGVDETRVSVTETDPLLPVHNVRWSGDDAGVSGTLRYLEDANCIVLDESVGTERRFRWVVVWPPGTIPWRENGELAGVMIPWTGIIRFGDQVNGGGGSVDSHIDLPDVPPQCLAPNGSFAMLHEL